MYYIHAKIFFMDTIEEKLDLIITIVQAHDKSLIQINQRLDEIDQRLDLMDQRLDLMDSRMNQIDNGMAQVLKRLDRIEDRLDKYEDKITDVYETRKFVAVKFTGAWAAVSFFIAVLSSLTAVVITKTI